MFKLRLYLFLSKFIPYFKRMVTKKSILDIINNRVCVDLQNFKDFNIYNGILVNTDNLNNYHKVEYKINYQDILFSIFIEYDAGNIKHNIQLNGNYGLELVKIADFFKELENIDLVMYFDLFNSAI